MWGGGSGGRGRVGGVHGGCDRRIEVFLKIHTKKKSGGGGSVWGGRFWGDGQGGCERRIEVFVKIQKKMGGGGGSGVGVRGRGRVGGGVRMDVVEELKFL